MHGRLQTIDIASKAGLLQRLHRGPEIRLDSGMYARFHSDAIGYVDANALFAPRR